MSILTDIIGRNIKFFDPLGTLKLAGINLGNTGFKLPAIPATAALQAAGAVAGSTPVPELQDIKYQEYTPEMYDLSAIEEIPYMGDLQTMSMSPTELRNILIDKNISDAQGDTLARFGDLVQQGGMTAIDRARLADIQAKQLSTTRGLREALMQQQAQRGQGGQNLEQLLQSAQAASDIASREGLNVEAMAQQRALDALAQRGALAGQMRSQQFGEKASVGSAQDAINEFNTRNVNAARERNLGVRQALAGQNVGQRNMLNQANVDLRNQAMGQNVDLRNQALNYNLIQKPQTIFGMKSGNAQAMAQGIAAAANMQNQNKWNQQAIDQQYFGAGLGALGNISSGAGAGGFFRK